MSYTLTCPLTRPLTLAPLPQAALEAAKDMRLCRPGDCVVALHRIGNASGERDEGGWVALMWGFVYDWRSELPDEGGRLCCSQACQGSASATLPATGPPLFPFFLLFHSNQIDRYSPLERSWEAAWSTRRVARSSGGDAQSAGSCAARPVLG